MTFLQSCSSLDNFPRDDRPEAALLGRSNVGKSSLINSLARQAHLARVSRTPGRTRLLNLFEFSPGLRLVDCPGYGYAKASRSLRLAWGELTQQYFERRQQLRLALLLVDASIAPQAIDLAAAAWLRERGIPFQLVATKWDKLASAQRARVRREFTAAFAAEPLPFSSKTGDGRDALRGALLRLA